MTARTVSRIYKVGTAAMYDYDRAGVTAGSRYGKPETLTAVTETYALPEDRSFSFVIDRLDMDETGGRAGSRQVSGPPAA